MIDQSVYVIRCKGDSLPEIVHAAGSVKACDEAAKDAERDLGQASGWVKIVDDRKGSVVTLNGNGIHRAEYLTEKKASAAAAKRDLVAAAEKAEAAIHKAKLESAQDAVKAANATLASVEASAPAPKKKVAKKKAAAIG